MASPRRVIIAVQCRSAIRPMTKYRTSFTTCAVDGSSATLPSNQSACAASKSMPCFSLFAALFAGSYSNLMPQYRIEIIPFQSFNVRQTKTPAVSGRGSICRVRDSRTIRKNYQSSFATMRVRTGSFIAPRRSASRAITSETPSISNMMRPGLTLAAQ